jgi:F0F1-type ATP synthase membrane subunit a
MVVDNIGLNRGRIFPVSIFSIFFYILCLNVVGLVPIVLQQSHFIIYICFKFVFFIGIISFVLEHMELNFFRYSFGNFGCFSFFLLVPIELISHFKPVSLSIRLFANMSGHTVEK